MSKGNGACEMLLSVSWRLRTWPDHGLPAVTSLRALRYPVGFLYTLYTHLKYSLYEKLIKLHNSSLGMPSLFCLDPDSYVTEDCERQPRRRPGWSTDIMAAWGWANVKQPSHRIMNSFIWYPLNAVHPAKRTFKAQEKIGPNIYFIANLKRKNWSHKDSLTINSQTA